eukprot:CAMPEP_0174828074 /NCGR_PEP_ID=MMETSP1114-20130205/1121_1 /TAXON_ID=312471 /ORGANISM="Neobodo designis, Strain CCAP 1951/1" /LENGTH=182 /DNA_ID=CAMNT_0016061777 /DNA_START=49 /DNA_END=593 /DNA_ORIENTATION=+
MPLERVEKPASEPTIFDACRKGDVERAMRYLSPEDRGSVTEPDRNNMTLLHHAAFGGNTTIVQALLECPGIPIDAVDALGWTPLLYAASNGNAEAAQLILDAGANTSAKDEMKRSSLHLAVTSTSASPEQKAATVRALLDGGVNPRLKNVAGMTARQTAEAVGAPAEIVNLFPSEAPPAAAA